jgi:hypothetical protein
VILLQASGLAAGKGVLLPQTKEEAVEGLRQLMVAKTFGSAADEVVIEQRLSGPEVSGIKRTSYFVNGSKYSRSATEPQWWQCQLHKITSEFLKMIKDQIPEEWVPMLQLQF